jgi:hypothetical protein
VSPAGREAVFEHLLRQVLAIRAAAAPSPWPTTPPPDAVLVSYFLLDSPERGGAESFVAHTLPRLLSQLLHTSERQVAVYQGELRGRVIWPATYKARHSGDFDPSLYACQEVFSRFDTPENQLLKYMISALDSCLTRVPEAIRAGFCYSPDGSGQAEPAITPRLRRVEAGLAALRRNVRLREVSCPRVIEETHLVKAECARIEEYASVARLYRSYHSLVLHPAWATLAQVGRRTLLLPPHPSPGGDAWINLAARLICA